MDNMQLFTQIEKTNQVPPKGDVVLVHGSWASSAMWMIYIQPFSQRGWNIYALDLRGHGRSSGEVAGTTMSDYVSDIHQVIVEYSLENPIIIGHSMGGLAALMYAVQYGARAIVAIDPSPSKEVQGRGEQKEYPETYSPVDAGMPIDLMEVMKALPDIPQEKLMKMKEMFGKESGVARSERKLGISVPKEKISTPVLFVGGELSESVPFGIGIKTTQSMAEYYGKELIEIKGATHPGILLGEHAMEAVEKIENWIVQK